MKEIEEIKEEAKAYRKVVSRKSLGQWEVKKDRSVVIELLAGQEATRLKALIPVRHERMAASPFAFFRGTAIIQAHDIASDPGTKFMVQACGDAHISNFGIFASPERRILFDINDFDETNPAPFDVDIKRLLSSIEICGRERSFSKECREKAVFDAAAMYRTSMRSFSEMGNMEVWYKHFDMERFLEQGSYHIKPENVQVMRAAIDKALTHDSNRAVRKLTETVDGKLRIKSDPPLIVPIRDMPGKEKELFDFHYNLAKAFELYKESLPFERRGLIEQYEPVELAHKVVGVGSVGLKAWILVLIGRDNGDPLVLQIKQTEKSVLEQYYGQGTYMGCGQRVVQGQRLIQTAGDILLGWMNLELPDGRRNDYYIRQLYDAKGSFDLEKITESTYHGLSLMCAWTLAHAHAKTGNRHAISGYLGKSDVFENTMVKYAKAYADQNEADYETFLKYFKE
ncbi:MAG: DUF2252 domain-containing protein [Butyrivibrio sp.]|nr:DUF2252 domain-containing protein [Butyrivibrio sp.]